MKAFAVTDRDATALPPHIEGTVQAIARLHAEHENQASRTERAIDAAAAVLGRPVFFGITALFVGGWIVLNVLLPEMGARAFDPPPFEGLVGLVALVSLFMSTLILISQRRAARLAARREQMTLEVSILSEQKAAKIIELLEELRRDSPNVPDRIDIEAKAMAHSEDPQVVLEIAGSVCPPPA